MPLSDETQRPHDVPIADPLRPDSLPPAPAVAPDLRDPGHEAATTRPGGLSKARVGVVAGAAMALAIGGVATALAAPSPATTPVAATGTTSTAPGLRAPLLFVGPGIQELDEAFDHGRMDHAGFRDITIASINGSAVGLKTADGWSRTINVTGSVTLTKGGQTINVGDLSVGDQVRVVQTRNDDGTFTVTGLVVVVPSVHGTVSDVSSSGFKVTGRDGSVWTITVDGSTKYQFGTADGTLADVTNGERVVVLGTSTGDNSLKALTVRVTPDQVAGTVTSKTADTIVITLRDGTTKTIHVDSDTIYRVRGVDSASLSDISVDLNIGVAGRARSDGSIDADVVTTGRGGFGGHGPGGGFPGGRGGFGPGGFDGPEDDAGTTTG